MGRKNNSNRIRRVGGREERFKQGTDRRWGSSSSRGSGVTFMPSFCKGGDLGGRGGWVRRGHPSALEVEPTHGAMDFFRKT